MHSRFLLRRFACVSASALITAPRVAGGRGDPPHASAAAPFVRHARARQKLSQGRRREKVRTVRQQRRLPPYIAREPKN